MTRALHAESAPKLSCAQSTLKAELTHSSEPWMAQMVVDVCGGQAALPSGGPACAHSAERAAY
jgi:hypothetical protein